MFLKTVKTVDIVFFVLIGVAILICVGIYFLMPIIKRREYREQREALAKREETFKANLAANSEMSSSEEEQNVEESSVESEVTAPQDTQ